MIVHFLIDDDLLDLAVAHFKAYVKWYYQA